MNEGKAMGKVVSVDRLRSIIDALFHEFNSTNRASVKPRLDEMLKDSVMDDDRRILNLKHENGKLWEMLHNLESLAQESEISIQANEKGYVVYGDGCESFGKTLWAAIDDVVAQRTEDDPLG